MDTDEFDEVHLPDDFEKSANIGSIVAYQALALKFKQLFNYTLPLVQHDNVKGAIQKIQKRNLGNETSSIYPFFHVSMTSTGLKPDSHIPKNIARYGSGYTVDPEKVNAMGTKHYVFWSETAFEFTCEFQDFKDCLAFIDKFAIVLATKTLSTSASVDNEVWSVIITGDSQISVPKATREDESRPNVYMVTHTITVYSHIGEMKDVPKVNNEGRIDTSITVDNTLAT